ncbi:MAG: tetratricopeptide repeat protein [Pseudohongiellaceae bacterium]
MAKSKKKRNKRSSGSVGASALARKPAHRQFLRWTPENLALLALPLLVLVSYWPVLFAGYVWDDKIFLDAAPVSEWAGVLDIWFDPRQVRQEAHYWPLLYSSFWLEHKLLFGFNPLASHVVNLLLHSANTVLLWRLLTRLDVPAAWFIAAVFAVHPVHVEAVAWAIGRKDLLATLFYLLAAGSWLRFRERPKLGTYLPLVALFIAGMLSKSLIITLPAALLIHLWWKHGRITKTDVRQVAPLFLIGAIITILQIVWYNRRAVIDFNYDLLERLVIAPQALWFYAGKLLWPHPLMGIYPQWNINPGILLNWLPLLAGLALILGLWLARHRIGRGPLAGALLFAVMLSPMIGLALNAFMQFSFVADRYQYLASASLIAVLVGIAVTLLKRIPTGSKEQVITDGAGAITILEEGSATQDEGTVQEQSASHNTTQGAAIAQSSAPYRLGSYAVKILAALVLVGYGVLTWNQAKVYRDDVTLWGHTITMNPDAHSGYYNYGLALVDAGKPEEGVAAYRTSIEKDPDSAGTYINLSFALLELERLEESAEAARYATVLDPEALLAHQNLASALHKLERYEETLASLQEVAKLMRPVTAEHYFHMGHIATLLERRQQAEDYLRNALTVDPAHQDALSQLTGLYLDTGRYQQAVEINPNILNILKSVASRQYGEGNYEPALENYQHSAGIDPNDAQVHLGQGYVLEQLERLEEAEQSYQRALAIEPNLQAALSQLAALYFNDRRFEDALNLYRRTVELEPNSAEAHSNLGSALAQSGQLQEAIASFERALELDPQLASARTNLDMAQQILESR